MSSTTRPAARVVNPRNLSVSIEFNWDDVRPLRQTNFPVFKNEHGELRAHLGSPPQNTQYTVRIRQFVHLHPPLRIKIGEIDGRDPSSEEEVTVTIVDEEGKKPQKGTISIAKQWTDAASRQMQAMQRISQD